LTPNSGSRKRLIFDARALLAYLAVEETGHKATDVARVLGIKRVSVHASFWPIYHNLKNIAQ